MAERQVTKTRKDKDGDISALCNPGTVWSPRLKVDAIRDIDNRVHQYYVKVGNNRVDIHVVHERPQPYLRTDPDKTSRNNLDDLPDC